MARTYEIETNVTADLIGAMREDYANYEEEMGAEEKKESKERIRRMKEYKDNFKVSTLEEYFDALDEISDITDGNYRILNGGKYIEFFGGYD